jgi:lysophospholipase
MKEVAMQRRRLLRASVPAMAAALLSRARPADAAQDPAAKHHKKPASKPVEAKPAPRPTYHPAPRPAASQPGPGITTEAELPSSYPGAIAAFWTTGENGQFISTRGENVHIRFMSFPRQGADTAIVIASGRTEGLIKYKELIYDLNRNGYSVFIHDHRGQGSSTRLLSDPMIGHVEQFEDYVADLKTFFDDQVKPTGHKRHILLSHSMGGCIASLYLEEHQRDFDRAVLSSPMHEPKLPAAEATLFAASAIDTVGLGDRFIPGGHPYDHVREFDPATNEFTHSRIRWETAWDEYNANPAAKLGSPSIHWVRVAYAAGRTAQDRAGRIVVPILLLQASDDTSVVNSAQNRFHARLNSVHPDSCTLVTLNGARHELFIEADEYRTPALDRILAYLSPSA